MTTTNDTSLEQETHDCGMEDWDHHFDPDSTLGDYYTCSVCGELTQVG
jgi:hypothetical protein